MPTTGEREDKKIVIEFKKLCLERWKLVATLLLPIVGFATITFQLNSQKDLKEKEIESQLFIKAIEAKDNDSLLRKLVYTGALDDSKKKYSFLIGDTVWVYKPGRLNFEDTTSKSEEKNISCGWPNHNKLIGNRIDANNFSSKIYSNGDAVLEFDLGTNEFIESFTATLILKDSNDEQIALIVFPVISIPPYGISKRKRVIYHATDQQVKDNFNKITCAGTYWETK